MGLFSFTDYNKNGPGVSKNEKKKNAFFLFWEIFARKFWRLVQLNMIFVLSLCTVIFAGPGMAGFAYVLRNFSQERHAFVWSDYIDAAKKNLKQSIAVFWINTFLFAALGVAIYFWYSMYQGSGSIMHSIPLMVCVLGAVILLFMQYYIYLIMVTFDISLKKLYKDALILAFYALPKNILTTLIVFLASLLVVVFSFSFGGDLVIGLSAFGIILLIFIYFSFVGFAAVSISYPVIKKTMIDPYKDLHAQNTPKLSENDEISDEERVFSDEPSDTDSNGQ